MNALIRRFTRLGILASSIAALTTTTRAASIIWDADGAANEFGGGTGSWDQISPLWSTNGVYGPWNNVTNAADTAVFGGSPGSVFLTEPISAGGLQFDVTGYTLEGGGIGLTLANNAVIGTNFGATDAVTINAQLGGTNLIFNPVTMNSTLPNFGQGRIVLNAGTANTGTTTINGGVLELNEAVTMTTGTGIIVNGSGLYHPSSQSGADYPFHRLHLGMLKLNGNGDFFGSQMVTLNGGTILRLSLAGGNDTGTVQNLTLGSGESTLASGPSGASAGDTLAITNLIRNQNATVQFRSQYGPLGANGDNGKISIGTINGAPVANTNGILGGWAFANEVPVNSQGNGFETAFAAWDAGLGSVTAALPDKSTAAGGALANQTFADGAATDNWLVSNNATITTDLTVNSVIEQNDIIINNGATLKIASGGLIFRTNNFWTQSADASGQITSLEANGNLYLNAATTIDALVDLRLRVRVVDNDVTPVQLIKSGNGSVLIGQYNSGASTGNSYTGGTIIQAGRLATAALDAFGTGLVTVLPGGQAYLATPGSYANNFDLSGAGAPENAGVLGAVRFTNATSIIGNVTLSSTARLTTFGAGETGTISGIISGAGSVEKTGAGRLVISGGEANTYTGDTLIAAGTLTAGKAQPFGPAGAGIVKVRGGSLDTNSQDLGEKTVDIQGTGNGGAGAVINDGGGVTVGLQKLQLSGDATIGGNNRWDVRGGTPTVTLNNFTLTKTGNNLISLVGAAVSPGNIVVNQGQLGIESGATVLAAPGSSIQVNAGGFLWVHDYGPAITVTRDLTLNGGELTSNAGGANGSSVVGSNITVPIASTINVEDPGATMRLTGAISGPAGLTKIGNGTLRLDGAIADLPSLNVTGGTVGFGATSNLPAGAIVTFGSGALLDQTGAPLTVLSTTTLVIGRIGEAATDVMGNLTFASGSTFNIGGTGVASTATFANNLTLGGVTISADLGNTTTPGGGVSDLVTVGGTLDLSAGNITVNINQLGALTNGSYTLFAAASLIGNAASFNPLAAIPNSRQTVAIDTTTVANTVLLNVSGSKSLTWVGGQGGNSWDVTTTPNWNDGVAADVFYNLDEVKFGDTGAGNVVLNGTLRPSSTTVDASADYTFSGTGKLSGSNTLIKAGTGTLIIANSGVNDFTGTTTVNGGVLQIGDGTNGTIGTGEIINNASVVLRLADNTTLANVISGSGTLTKADNTTLILTGASTYTGPTVVNGGTLSIATIANGGTPSAIGAGPNTAENIVLDGGTLRYTGAEASTDHLISLGLGGGGIESSGTGALSFTNGAGIGFVGIGARTFTLKGDNTGNNQFTTAIGNEGGGATSLIKDGLGTWVLNGGNSFTGGVTVNAGVLAVDGNQNQNRIPSGNAVVINNGAVLEVRGVNAIPVNGPLTININEGSTLRLVTGGSASTGAGGTSHAHLGTLTLSGGTIDLAYFGSGAAYDNESAQLDGDVTVTGTTPSSVTTTQPINLQGLSLNGIRTFNVEDVTASPATDFTVAAELENRDGGVAGGIFKTGAGTMLLTRQNTFTGSLTVDAGTVAVDGAQVFNTLSNNASILVQNTGTFELRGVNALPADANAVDVTVEVGGTLRVQSGGSDAIGAGGDSHDHIRNLVLNGGSVDLHYSGAGTAYNGESFLLNGDVTVGGAALSVIDFSGGATMDNQGIGLNGNRSFTVNDAVTGTDLKVIAQLENSANTPNDSGITKLGAGTMEIAGVSDYSGATIINEGSLLVSGSLTGTNSITVAGGATLGGSGTIAPGNNAAITLASDAVLAPGTNGVGMLIIDSSVSFVAGLLTFQGGAKLDFEFGDSVHLAIGSAGDISFSDNILTLSGTPVDTSYVLFSADVADAYTGLFVDNGKILTGLSLDPAFMTAFPDASLELVGNDIVVTNVPEPAAATILLGGLAMLASRRRRQA